MTDMVFEGTVDETEVGKITEGMDIVLRIGAIADEEFDAKLRYISPKGREQNGAIQFEIKADVNLKEGQFIRAGYSANADIVLEKREDVLVIPEGLLKFEKDSSYVEIEVDSQVFEKRFVDIGLSDGINVEVLDGISKDDKIKEGKFDLKKEKKATQNNEKK